MSAEFSPHQVKVDLNSAPAGLGCLAAVLLTCFFAMALGATAASAQERNSYLRPVTIEPGAQRGSINCFGCSVVVKGDLKKRKNVCAVSPAARRPLPEHKASYGLRTQRADYLQTSPAPSLPRIAKPLHQRPGEVRAAAISCCAH